MGLTINDIMPENPKLYDKMRPPKREGQPTTVYFHVTVMGLDSIDETSMVSLIMWNIGFKEFVKILIFNVQYKAFKIN
jgi:hypothetical protein